MALATVSNKPPTDPEFSLEMELMAADFLEEWKRCDLVANYVAEYTAYQFGRREFAENFISTILNEMIETVISLVPQDSLILLTLTKSNHALIIKFEHNLDSDFAQVYPDFLALLSGSLTDELYLKILTDNSDTTVLYNQVGLAILVHDFRASLSFQPPVNTKRSSTVVRVAAQELV